MLKNKLLERATETFERQRAEYERLVAGSECLPDLDYERITPTAYKADLGVRLVVEDPADVFPLLKDLPPAELVRVDSGCVSFIPAACPLKQHERATPVACLTLRTEHVSYGPPLAALWYAALSGKVVQVEARIARGHDFVRWEVVQVQEGRGRTRSVERFRHRFPGALAVKWAAATGVKCDRTLYWPAGTAPEDILAAGEHWATH